jgi:hypothetical protein
MDESKMEADALADLADMKRADIDDHFGDYLQTSGLAESPDERHVADGGNGEDGWGGVGGGGGVGGVDGADRVKCKIKTVGDDVHRGARGAEGMNEAQGRTDSCRRLEWYWEGGRGYWEGGREGGREGERVCVGVCCIVLQARER